MLIDDFRPERAIEELGEPLIEIGRRWAESPNRPRPAQGALADWDKLLNDWVRSELPLIVRDSSKREGYAACADGRKVIFSDNTPANWAFELALRHKIPDINSWLADKMASQVPLSLVGKEARLERDLNKQGWKVCHIEPVSDRKRFRIEEMSREWLEARFRRFLSPRNIFLIPKLISGAGELPQVIRAVKEYERSHSPLPQKTVTSLTP